MRSITLVFTLLICAVFLLPFGSRGAQAVELGVPVQGASGAPAPDPAAERPPLVSWADLVARPRDHLNGMVRLRIQLHSRPESWNPMTTRFGTTDYAAVQGWADDQMPWFEPVYSRPDVRLFMRRGSAPDARFDRARTHDRFEVEAVVRELHGRRPWLEVVAARGLHEHIPEGCVIHASRAVRLMNERRWDLALAELERATQAPLPDHAREGLEQLVELCEWWQAEERGR